VYVLGICELRLKGFGQTFTYEGAPSAQLTVRGSSTWALVQTRWLVNISRV